MQGTLYRYPHPTEPNKFLYVGQGAKRDKDHRAGRSSFGRRFKRDFPCVELPQPILETVEVVDREHLNSMETAWMVLYATLSSVGGMNLTLPGSDDYRNLGKLGGPIGGRIAGRKNIESGHITALGRKNVESGRLAALGRIGGRVAGRIAVESGQLASVASLGGRVSGRANAESGHITALARSGVGGRKGGPIGGKSKSPKKLAACASNFRIASHNRWHVRRNIINPNCELCRTSKIAA